MPLVLICGYPSSGKSRIAGQIKDYLENDKQKVVKILTENSYVNHHMKNAIYAGNEVPSTSESNKPRCNKSKIPHIFLKDLENDNDATNSDIARGSGDSGSSILDIIFSKIADDSAKEKSVRSAIRGDVERYLSRENVLILDGLNYIKGFRYELHCIVKAEKTLHCVIYCGIPKEKCWEFNSERPEEEQYNETTFSALVMRFEEPDGRNRWDSPLFTKLVDHSVDLEEIYNSLYNRNAPPPNQSTLPTPVSSGNFMRDLDQVTQSAITEILDLQKTAMIGDRIKITGTNERLNLTKKFNIAELRRTKRQFIAYAKMHPVEDVNKLKNMFIQFLNNSIH